MGPLRAFLRSYIVMLDGFAEDEVQGSANPSITAILLIAFTIFTNIIMLNLLIAVMGDIFDKIQENA
ncbi:hypothetical protein TrST_g5343 [Triparma strigata]|uniref:Ion transport domain-containing protein n=1 Tax=Triparma strigata TaxID=1606541 RepID=A0A9W7B517_9STRA|nr:hypothetical protein TrST_g5343 [Triparma strigata]